LPADEATQIADIEEVQQLISKGQEQGYLTYEQIQDTLGECELLDTIGGGIGRGRKGN